MRGFNTKCAVSGDGLALFKTLMCRIRLQNKLLGKQYIFKFSCMLSTSIPINLNLYTKPKTKELMGKKWYVCTEPTAVSHN